MGELQKRIRAKRWEDLERKALGAPPAYFVSEPLVQMIVGEMTSKIPQDILLVLQNVAYASKARNEDMILRLSSEDCNRLVEWFVRWLMESSGKEKQ